MVADCMVTDGCWMHGYRIMMSHPLLWLWGCNFTIQRTQSYLVIIVILLNGLFSCGVIVSFTESVEHIL